MPESNPFLTKPKDFIDVSRGNPVPHSLTGEALVKARLTPETWRLELVAEGGAKVQNPKRLEDGTALRFSDIREMGKSKGVRFLKGMQCLNIPLPLGQGLWEGVPLREVLKLVGRFENVRRVYYWGFHNNDPGQRFQSSVALSQVFDSPPGELPPFVAFSLNGQPLPLERGGPVRMVIPWAHGFKSIKWLQRIVLTNDHRANDTYADANNDPESYLKTAAYFLNKEAETFPIGKPILIRGAAMSGWPGLERVEYWLRPEAGTHGRISDDDPAWRNARWLHCKLFPPPDDWSEALPAGVTPATIAGFDSATGRPRDWPMRFNIAQWIIQMPALKPGGYEVRVRAVDKNGFAQPEPRNNNQSGLNGIQCKQFIVM